MPRSPMCRVGSPESRLMCADRIGVQSYCDEENGRYSAPIRLRVVAGSAYSHTRGVVVNVPRCTANSGGHMPATT
jgi:hypothetical protein